MDSVRMRASYDKHKRSSIVSSHAIDQEVEYDTIVVYCVSDWIHTHSSITS